MLQDLQGNEWRVEIDSNRKELYNRICLSRGWNDGSFLESNVGSSSIHLLAPAPADEENKLPR